MKSAKCRVVSGKWRTASRLSLLLACCQCLAAQPASSTAPSSTTPSSFDVVALVDSLDFAKDYDIETKTGTVQE